MLQKTRHLFALLVHDAIDAEIQVRAIHLEEFGQQRGEFLEVWGHGYLEYLFMLSLVYQIN